MSTPSQDAVAIVDTTLFRERVRDLLLRHGAELMKVAYPEIGQGSAEDIATAEAVVVLIHRINDNDRKLRNVCHHIISEYPTPLLAGSDLSDNAILGIIASGIVLWGKAEQIVEDYASGAAP